MRTSWIVSLALIGFGCSSTASDSDAPRNGGPSKVNLSVPVRAGTGTKDAAEVVDLAHARITRAYDIMAARWSCYMPAEIETLVFSDSKKWKDPEERPPLPEPGQSIDRSYSLDWVRFESNQEDYDFLGVNVDLSPVGRSIVVTSKFGHVPGLLRVVEWVHEKLKP